MRRNVSAVELGVKLLLWVYLGWAWCKMLGGISFMFVDNFNLAIHEAGHVLFFFGGPMLSTWGGTLLQLSIPFVCFIYFAVVRGEPFSGGMCGWWMGENLVNVGIYVADANKRSLPLVGGGGHDWAYILGRARMLPLAETIGGGVRWLGLGLTLAALIWMMWVVIRQYRAGHGG